MMIFGVDQRNREDLVAVELREFSKRKELTVNIAKTQQGNRVPCKITVSEIFKSFVY